MRRGLVIAVCLLAVASAALADDFDIAATLKTSFSDIARLPTRLTYYNQHDDAATASYTCCRVRQEREIQAALVANAAFLNRFSDTPFADDTYMHYGYVSSFKPEAFRNEEWAYRSLVELFPDSDLADDAAWMLGNLYKTDHDHERAIQVFEYLVRKWPESPWADDALNALLCEFNYMEDTRAALAVLNDLAYKYPKSEFCPGALAALAQKYMEVEDYQSAINASRDLIRDFPYSDLADDAQMRIAECLRLSGDLQGALDAYREMIHRWYGSDLTNRAMREANELMRRIQGGTGRVAGELYDTMAWNPAKDAEELWSREAKHYQNNGMHSRAIAKFREFIDKFPGNDRWDDAWYEMGMTYLRQDQLFQEINNAAGPEDRDRLAEDYEASTGDTGPVPDTGDLSALRQATECFAYIANNLQGSSLRCEALGMVARCFIKYGEIEGPVPPDAAYTYQEIVIHFPFSSCRLPFFSDASVPVYSFCRLMTFYADEANWDIAKQIYPELSREYPDIFPVGLETDKESFYELMRLYALKTNHAYYEMSRHIKYNIGPADLLPESHYYRGAMLMGQGDYDQAARLLQRVATLRGHDLVAPALYLYAQANAKLGRWDEVREALTRLIQTHPNSGLADDAQMMWIQLTQAGQNPAAYDVSAQAQDVAARYGIDPANMDTYIGERCVVFAPYTRCAMMRMYNMPNIWDEAQRVLRDWAGMPDNEKITIVVDRNNESTFGNPFKVAGTQIQDPPAWNLGLAQISANVLAQGIPNLAQHQDLLGGIASFVAASLQYDLVTETRDAIGSAAAVKLPQEEVLRAREAALKALQDYVVAGEDAPLTASVIAGMMYSLLDTQGFSKDRLIDREPYRAFFAKLKELPARTEGQSAFAIAATTAFGDGCGQQLKDWRLPLPASATAARETKVGQVR